MGPIGDGCEILHWVYAPVCGSGSGLDQTAHFFPGGRHMTVRDSAVG